MAKINGKYEVSKGLELGIKKFLHTGVVNVFDDEGDKAEKVCHCPVCGSWHNRHYRAVDCCLWREVEFRERLEMSRQLQEGKKWEEILTLTE